jgi:hypothetical protein
VDLSGIQHKTNPEKHCKPLPMGRSGKFHHRRMSEVILASAKKNFSVCDPQESRKNIFIDWQKFRRLKNLQQRILFFKLFS